MFIFSTTGKRVNPYASYTTPEGIQYPNLTDPEVQYKLGITEIPDPVPPEDFSEETYFRTESEFPPYLVFTPRPQEQIDATENNKLIVRMEALESRSLRAIREAVLSGNLAKLQELEDKIVALRRKLKKQGEQNEPASNEG